MTSLGLGATAVTDASLGPIGKLPALESVSLGDTRMTVEAVAAFRLAHPGVRADFQ